MPNRSYSFYMPNPDFEYTLYILSIYIVYESIFNVQVN